MESTLWIDVQIEQLELRSPKQSGIWILNSRLQRAVYSRVHRINFTAYSELILSCGLYDQIIIRSKEALEAVPYETIIVDASIDVRSTDFQNPKFSDSKVWI